MPRWYRGRRRKAVSHKKNGVIHVPSTIGAAPAANVSTVFVIASPSIFAAGSASANIEAQDKDRTVNVGHYVGTLTLDLAVRDTTTNGLYEFCVYKVERADSTPALGTHPVPSTAECLAQGTQQACRLANPGRVYHYSQRAYTGDMNVSHKIRVSPAKFKVAKLKAGDHWILQVFNRGGTAVTFDFQARYYEYE